MIPTQNNHNSDIFGDHRITFDQKKNENEYALILDENLQNNVRENSTHKKIRKNKTKYICSRYELYYCKFCDSRDNKEKNG